MEPACLGSCDPAKLLLPICEIDKAIPLSGAFSKGHQEPVWVAYHIVGPLFPSPTDP